MVQDEVWVFQFAYNRKTERSWGVGWVRVRLNVQENSLSTVCLRQEIRYKLKSKKVLWLGFSHRRRKKIPASLVMQIICKLGQLHIYLEIFFFFYLENFDYLILASRGVGTAKGNVCQQSRVLRFFSGENKRVNFLSRECQDSKWVSQIP